MTAYSRLNTARVRACSSSMNSNWIVSLLRPSAGRLLFVTSALLAILGSSPVIGAENPRPSFDQEFESTVLEFRAAAVEDITGAVATYGRGRVKEIFACDESSVWPSVDTTLGWSYFFGTSIWAGRVIAPRKALALFYHPWSDVAIVTEWEQEAAGGQVRMNEAMMLMGDFLRQRGNPPFDTIPRFARSQIPAALGAGLSGAVTVKLFQQAFSGVAFGQGSATKWKSVILEVDDEEGLAVNRIGVVVLLKRCLASLEQYFSSPDLKNVRNKVGSVLENLQGGTAEDVLEELTETPAEIREYLRKIGTEKWRDMNIVCYVDSGQSGTVFLAPSGDPSFYAALLVTKGEMPSRSEKYKRLVAAGEGADGSRLVRIDAFSVPMLYENFEDVRRICERSEKR